MRPKQLSTKIFLDGGDPAETKEIINILGFLDGQTTNPTLIAKNPYAQKRFKAGDKFSKTEIFDFYKKVVKEISGLIPNGSVSIEVYCDEETYTDQMFEQAKDMFTWIHNAHIKYPITDQGLEAAERSIANQMRVNMTLCFTQSQAAAVYAATLGAKKGDVFVSPFIGRLDDKNENGMDLIGNIVEMFSSSDDHVEVLAASVRSMDHFMQSLALKADIITAPFGVLKEWGSQGMPLPGTDFVYNPKNLSKISYEHIDLTKPWQDYDIQHELTTNGVQRFASDWNELLD